MTRRYTRLLTENLGMKVLSVAVAVLLWYAIIGSSQQTTTLAVPIQLRNLPDTLEISSEFPDTADVELRGPARRLTTSNLTGVAIVLDLSDAKTPGERTLSVLPSNISLPPGVEFLRAVPAQVRLKLETQIGRDVSVVPRYLKLPDGWEIGESDVSPSTVRIIGPEEKVAGIDRIQTDPIDVKPADQEVTVRVHAYSGDPHVRLERPDQLFTVKVKPRPTRKDDNKEKSR